MCDSLVLLGDGASVTSPEHSYSPHATTARRRPEHEPVDGVWARIVCVKSPLHGDTSTRRRSAQNNKITRRRRPTPTLNQPSGAARP